MKIITIYSTLVKLPVGITLNDLQQGKDFEELLDENITFERERELIDRCQQHGIDIHEGVALDGSSNERLFNKDALKAVLAAVNGENGAYGKYFDAAKPEVVRVGDEDFDKLTPLFKVARQFGISLQINTCSDEDFRSMSKEEAERVGEAIKKNIKLNVLDEDD